MSKLYLEHIDTTLGNLPRWTVYRLGFWPFTTGISTRRRYRSRFGVFAQHQVYDTLPILISCENLPGNSWYDWHLDNWIYDLDFWNKRMLYFGKFKYGCAVLHVRARDTGLYNSLAPGPIPSEIIYKRSGGHVPSLAEVKSIFWDAYASGWHSQTEGDPKPKYVYITYDESSYSISDPPVLSDPRVQMENLCIQFYAWLDSLGIVHTDDIGHSATGTDWLWVLAIIVFMHSDELNSMWFQQEFHERGHL